jgi:ABC-type antimicrobial peptide transport system permease subunit
LGAARHQVQALVVRQEMALVLAGMGIGLVLGTVTTRVILRLLYATSPTDGGTLAGVTARLASGALFPCCWPARRASRVDPMIALRAE